MVIGILTEKPSAARNLAAALGGMSGQYNGEQFVITHARGHLYEFAEPHQMLTNPALADRYQSWDIAHLPWNPTDLTWRLEVIPDARDTAADVKRTLAGCEELVIATDVDPTGEGGMIAVNAFRELDLHPRRWSRMHFTDEAAVSLQRAFTTRTPIPSLDEFDEYKKAVYRSKFDFLSMQWTRSATRLAQSTGRDMVLRQGRLKSAMVSLVGDQVRAHLSYVKKPFFQNRFRDENGVTYTDADEPRFEAAADVPTSYAAATVVHDSTETKHTVPPKLLDLATLSALLGAEGAKAKDVLATYQQMYEAQVVSYPRTEDKTITPEQFNELAPLIDQIAAVVNVDPSLLSHREPRKTHVKAEGAHGANRPGLNVPASLEAVGERFGQTGRLIYERLAKSYLAMLAADYTYEQQRGHLQEHPTFTGLTNVPRNAGWKSVFDPDASDDTPADDDTETENSTGLGTIATVFVYEGANKRPEHPSMRWLMKQLEKRQVGTGATRTSTYSDVTSTATKHPLLVEKGRKLTLAEAGLVSWRLIHGTRIGSLELTETVYADMRNIAAGTANAEDLLARIATWVQEDITIMTKNAAAIGVKEGADITPKERVTGVWRSREVTFARTWGGHRFTDEQVQQLLAGNTIEFEARTQDNRRYDVYGALAERVHNGKTYVGFTKVGFGRRDATGAVLPPRQWCSHTFTDAELRTLIEGGTVEASDFISRKTRKRFRAKVTFRAEKPGESKKLIADFT